MDKLIEILEEIQPDADYETCETLIDDGILDSFAILSIVRELAERARDYPLDEVAEITEIPAEEIVPENFNSAAALWEMVCRLKG